MAHSSRWPVRAITKRSQADADSGYSTAVVSNGEAAEQELALQPPLAIPRRRSYKGLAAREESKKWRIGTH